MPRRTKPGVCLPALLAAVLCGLAIVVILCFPQPVGLANNGDFQRVIHTNGIAYIDGNPNKDRFVTDYLMVFRGDTATKKLASVFILDFGIYGYRSSQSVPVIISKVLNLAWNRLTGAPAARYCLVWLGLVYTGAFVCALYLILSFVRRRFGRGMFVFAALAGLFVFCDQGYLLYFNSFYGEAMQYVSTFLAIGLFLRLTDLSAARRVGAPYNGTAGAPGSEAICRAGAPGNEAIRRAGAPGNEAIRRAGAPGNEAARKVGVYGNETVRKDGVSGNEATCRASAPGSETIRGAGASENEASGPGFWPYFAYYCAVLAMTASKYAYAPVGVLFGLLPLVLRPKSLLPKWGTVGGALAVTLCAAALMTFYTPDWIERDTNFDAVFAGVLKYSDTPERDLEELGLDPGLAVLKGNEAYQAEYPIDVSGADFDARFYEKISKGKILEFYLRRPGRLWDTLKIAANWSKAIRPGYLANCRNPTVPAEQSRRFSLWETARGAIGVNRLWAIMGVFGLALGVIAWEIYMSIISRYKKKRDAAGTMPLVSLLGVILAAAVFNFVIPYMTNGICDIAKHMFGFIALYDLLMMILIGYISYCINGCFFARLCYTVSIHQ